MQKQKFVMGVICLIWAIALAGCGAAGPEQTAADPTADPAQAEETEMVAEAESTEAEPAEELAEEPSEEPSEVEPTEEAVQEADTETDEESTEEMADSETDVSKMAYGSFPPEWLNRNVLGDPEATVLVEAYEEFL